MGQVRLADDADHPIAGLHDRDGTDPMAHEQRGDLADRRVRPYHHHILRHGLMSLHCEISQLRENLLDYPLW